jgi:hypothetical protein
MSAACQPIAPSDGFEFDPDSVLDWNYGSCLHFKSGQGRAELVNGQRIVAGHQQVGRLSLSENLQYPLLDFSYSVGDPCGRSRSARPPPFDIAKTGPRQPRRRGRPWRAVGPGIQDPLSTKKRPQIRLVLEGDEISPRGLKLDLTEPRFAEAWTS